MTEGTETVRFAVITDVHANLPALNTVLRAIDAEGCDFIVHTGDAIGIGPYPAETLDRLLGRADLRFVMGNHDALFAFGAPSPRPPWISAEEEANLRWTHAQIDRGLRDVVRHWPYRSTLEINGRTVVFCHYARTPEQRASEGRDHPDPLLASGFMAIVANPTGRDLDRLFQDHPADLLFYGHHHPRSDLTGHARYVNPGATGCGPIPVARYALATVRPDGEIDVVLCQAPYDRTALLADLDTRGVPARNVIRSIFFGIGAR